MNKIKRLQAYIIFVNTRISITTGEKKLFFERELKKALVQIERLTK